MSLKNYLTESQKLNERQREAYDSKGNCVVLAGPGSGKTHVLTTKMARMLAEDVRYPRGIACITYSNQCAKELQKRLEKLGVDETSRVFIGTVHSFCLKNVIVPYAKLAGEDIANPIKIATSNIQREVFSKAVSAVLGSNKNPNYIRTPFDEFRRTVLDRNSSTYKNNKQYAPLVHKYEQLLSEAGLIDFDGMVLHSLNLIRKNKWICDVLKARFPILVVDEYQDLGIPLHEIVLQLCFNDGDMRLFAVGDPDQSIYGFTGARPELLYTLSEKKDDVQSVRLRMNYRCGQKIITASTTALAEERDFESANEYEGIVEPHYCPKGFDEQMEEVIKIIHKTLETNPERHYGNIAILYVDRNDGQKIADTIEKAKIQYVRFDQGNPYQRSRITNWLEDCAAWCLGGWEKGEPKLSSLFKKLREFTPSITTDSEVLACRRNLTEFLFSTRLKEDIPLIDWLESFKVNKLYDRIKIEPTLFDEVELLEIFFESCKEGKPLAEYTVKTFEGQRGSPDHLNLTTIHSAKGLEYDVVIMVGLEQGRIPNEKNNEKEERRKFYVALTRARHEVYLLCSGWYKQGDRINKHGHSKFVCEMINKLNTEHKDE